MEENLHETDLDLRQSLLKLPGNITTIERDGKILFFNPDMPAWMVTNANGALLLSLCNGENTVDDILDALSDIQTPEQQQQTLRFFKEAVDSGIFSLPSTDECPVAEERQPLSSVQLSISSKCNLNCKYCYATDRRENHHPKMTLDDYKRVVDDILDYAPGTEFSITGGEPLLNPDACAIAAYIRSRKSGVDLLTNATLLDEQNIERIAEVFDKVTVSLDGSSEEKHDRFRGRGAYARTMHALELLEQHGVPYFLSMTVNRLNIDDVEAMAAIYGDKLGFAPLFPAGNAKKGTEDISITGLDYFNALKRAAGVKPLGYCESTLDAAVSQRRCKCAVGGAEISISETGDVYPCQLLHYPQFLMGNIHEGKVSDFHRHSAVCRQCAKMVVDNIEGCRSCFLRYVCGGACRARAFHECGDIMTSGRFCEYEKAAFIDGIFEIYSANSLSV